MIQRAGYDLLRLALRIALQLWPLWLFWFVWTLAEDLWRDFLLRFPDSSSPTYAFAYHAWPSAALAGPILLMAAAIIAARLHLATRLMPLAGIAGVAIATIATAWPEYQRLASYFSLTSLQTLDFGILAAVMLGGFATATGLRLTLRPMLGGRTTASLVRARSDNFGHADWLALRDARRPIWLSES